MTTNCSISFHPCRAPINKCYCWAASTGGTRVHHPHMQCTWWSSRHLQPDMDQRWCCSSQRTWDHLQLQYTVLLSKPFW